MINKHFLSIQDYTIPFHFVSPCLHLLSFQFSLLKQLLADQEQNFIYSDCKRCQLSSINDGFGKNKKLLNWESRIWSNSKKVFISQMFIQMYQNTTPWQRFYLILYFWRFLKSGQERKKTIIREQISLFFRQFTTRKNFAIKFLIENLESEAILRKFLHLECTFKCIKVQLLDKDLFLNLSEGFLNLDRGERKQ